MEPRALVLRVWLPLAALASVLLALALPPLATAWGSYRVFAGGEHAEARVARPLDSPELELVLVSGSRAGQVCVARTSAEDWTSLEPGHALSVVVAPGREHDCVPEVVLEGFSALLWLAGSLVALVVLGLLLVGVFLQRTFTARPAPTTRLDPGPAGVRCPACGEPMREGYVPLVAGLHWREPGAPVGLPHALSGLPGTTSWRERPRLHAWRCAPCEVLTLRYGRADAPGRRP